MYWVKKKVNALLSLMYGIAGFMGVQKSLSPAPVPWQPLCNVWASTLPPSFLLSSGIQVTFTVTDFSNDQMQYGYPPSQQACLLCLFHNVNGGRTCSQIHKTPKCIHQPEPIHSQYELINKKWKLRKRKTDDFHPLLCIAPPYSKNSSKWVAGTVICIAWSCLYMLLNHSPCCFSYTQYQHPW